jgi:hypothetical protein
MSQSILPTDAVERKTYPVASGVLDYFPAALAEVAKISYHGNQQHNPGQPLHWSRNKSTDQADTIIRHFLERGTVDPVDGLRHSAKLAWRALALLQLEMEAAGAPMARGASYDDKMPLPTRPTIRSGMVLGGTVADGLAWSSQVINPVPSSGFGKVGKQCPT